ncbi:sugar porter family MFS transporter [Sphingomonas psychrotolerans]|uniref:Sugar porter family MFS transporter n=1 Tax=Sphingomonas psychrotolerans TaxID=1327635 RepID=A0ABU3N4Q6_9SPHN|nr:sugar porter family MFS transporter [Sphingomonas psychrotolerans]MDT8758300.1 sugar porter family MFS transporter [Sphingomonas psychrotolerans]
MTATKRKLSSSAIVAASLAGLLFGFDTAVIAGVTEALRGTFGLSAAQLGAAVSAALVGTLVGALGAGQPGDRYGSRNILLWIAGAYIVSALGSALSSGLAMLVAFRFLGGLAIGGSSVLAPVYIAEVSPPERRGMLVGFFQLSIVLGILAAYVSNFLIGLVSDGELAWRLKLGVAAAPALLFLALMLRVPQSPRWLFHRGRPGEAAAAIKTLSMGDRDTLFAQFAQGATAPGEARLSWRKHRRPILLAIGLAAFNQLSGINAILYYLGDIFAAAGFDKLSSDLQAVAIGVANLAATVLGMAVIDRVGRKPLLLIGALGTAVALAGVALIYSTGEGQGLLLPALIGFILFFAISQGAVIWVYLSEIFPTAVRARGQSLGSATHWAINALIAFGFPVVAQYTQALPFWLFAGAMLVQAVVIWRYFPETRGVALETMERTVEGRG